MERKEVENKISEVLDLQEAITKIATEEEKLKGQILSYDKQIAQLMALVDVKKTADANLQATKDKLAESEAKLKALLDELKLAGWTLPGVVVNRQVRL